jgi:flagellar hook-associated protein 3 FlgL
MIPGINPSADQFLADINRLQTRSERAQRQLASGLRVTQASDDPDAVGNILETRARLARAEQTGRNLDRVKAEVDGAEAALSSAIESLEKIRVLGAQGANFSMTAAGRRGLAVEVQNLLERLIANANTAVEGRYVFSGDSDQSPAYAVDLTTLTGATPYGGTASTRQAQDPRGGAFATARTAQEIFEAPGAAGVLGAVNALRVALLANDEAAIALSLGNLKSAYDHLSEQLSYYGSAQKQVADARNAARALVTRFAADLSALEDADLAAATTELVTAQTRLEAAFSARAKAPQQSLFDYLR